MAHDYGDVASTKAIVEIDDVHHAKIIVAETMNVMPEFRMLRIAEMLAGLREYYVEIGRDLENNKARCLTNS